MSRQSIGAGIGLRVGHYDQILQRGVQAECAEIVSENFMDRGGRPHAVLERVRGDMPVIAHGVGLSLGSVDVLQEGYVRSLKDLVHRVDPLFVSDHLCFSSVSGERAYDLWPLPHTEEAIRHVSQKIRQVQDILGRTIAIENVSSYVGYQQSQMSEQESLRAVLEAADCLCLLDVNNIYVNARNHGFSAKAYIDGIPRERVAYYHLAGHSDYGTHLLDDHGSAVPESVWELYDYALRTLGPKPTIVEWDSHLPSLNGLEEQAQRAQLKLERLWQSDGR